MTQTKPNKKYILRVKTYWWVRIESKRKVVVSKVFTDSVYGGEALSLKAAMLYRDAQAKKLGLSLTGIQNHHKLDKRSKSGVVGVTLTTTTKQGQAKPYLIYFWRARLGTKLNRAFSVKKYGYEQAYILAVKERLRWSGETLETVVAPYHPKFKPKKPSKRKTQ
jgi:hypothetical protein